MERELGAAKEKLARETGRAGGSDPRDAEIQDLRQQNERLREEIRALRQQLRSLVEKMEKR
jgi:hypothetical protein